MSETHKTPGPNLHHHHLESTLCFPKDIFYATNFDVDSFVSHYKKEYSLERLRDDLSVFLKVLEMSMSDLINKDYPDFVNLSTNLVDLDKAINELKTPLEGIKSDVDSVKGSIDNEISLIMSKLNEKLLIEKRRIVLKLLMNWQRSLKVTNEMIGNSSQKISGDHVQRIAFEFCQLKNSLSICANEDKSSFLNQDIDKLSQVLENIMKDLFIDCLKVEQSLDRKQQLKHVLKSYTLLGKEKQAEDLFTEYSVRPYMDQFLNEDYLQNNIQKLNGVYEKIFEFIDLNSEFFQITNQVKNAGSTQDEVKTLNDGFEFLINSIWSHIVLSLDLNMSSIFSASDADLFHENFKKSFNFVSQFELKCFEFDKNFKSKFHRSQSFKYFTKKWPIQVYFQIRFQEIVTSFETDLLNYNNKADDCESFHLNVTESLIKQIEYLWSEQKCFLKCLLPQFWRLNLQIINRYALFFTNLIKPKIEDLSSGQQPQDSDLGLCFNLLNDVYQLYNFKLPDTFDGLIAPIVRASSSTSISINTLKESFFQSIQLLNELEIYLIDYISKINIYKCLSCLKMCNDIPRIYRRTNRDVPKTASLYVTQCIEVILLFKNSYSNDETKSLRQNKMVEKCVQNVIDSICLSYQSISSDLLESVKKMEDNLKLIQRVKQRNKSAVNLQNTSSVNDDDKIRIQLYLDILEFGRLLEENFAYKGESNYDALFKLVEDFSNLKQESNQASTQLTVHEENEIV